MLTVASFARVQSKAAIQARNLVVSYSGNRSVVLHITARFFTERQVL
jgi:hypothetical protein